MSKQVRENHSPRDTRGGFKHGCLCVLVPGEAMRYIYSQDEYYPFREISPETPYRHGDYEFTDEEYDDYLRVMTEFEEWQDRLERS